MGAGLGREGARGLQTPRPRGWEVRTKNSCAPPLTRGRPFSGCRKEAQRGEGHANPGQQPVPRGAEEPAAGPRAGRGAGECWDASSTPGLGAPPPPHPGTSGPRRGGAHLSGPVSRPCAGSTSSLQDGGHLTHRGAHSGLGRPAETGAQPGQRGRGCRPLHCLEGPLSPAPQQTRPHLTRQSNPVSAYLLENHPATCWEAAQP